MSEYKNNGSYSRRSLPFSPLSHFSPSPSPSLFAPATQTTQLRANENGINNIDLQLIDRHQSISTKWHQSGAPFASVRSFPKDNDIGQAYFLFSPPPSPLSFYRPGTYPKGYYFYSPQSSSVITSEMAATKVRT